MKLIFYLENLHERVCLRNFILIVMRVIWLDSSLVLLLCDGAGDMDSSSIRLFYSKCGESCVHAKVVSLSSKYTVFIMPRPRVCVCVCVYWYNYVSIIDLYWECQYLSQYNGITCHSSSCANVFPTVLLQHFATSCLACCFAYGRWSAMSYVQNH